MTSIHRASCNGRTEIVKLLLDRGANINEKDGDGNTPLHLASQNGHTETVELLKSRGATE